MEMKFLRCFSEFDLPSFYRTFCELKTLNVTMKHALYEQVRLIRRKLIEKASN
jgi:hypothetical protein